MDINTQINLDLFDPMGNVIKINDPVLYMVEDDSEVDAYIAVVVSMDIANRIVVLSMCDSIATRIETKVDKCLKLDISKKPEEGYLLQFIDSNNHYFYIGRGLDKPARSIETLKVFKSTRAALSNWRGLVSKNSRLDQYDPVVISYHEARRRLFIRRRRPELVLLNKKLRGITESVPDNLVYDKVIGIIGELEIQLAKEI